jgi:RNA polymerase-binding protein DksA
MNKSTLTARDRKRYREQLLRLRNRLTSDVVHLEAEASRSVGAENADTNEPVQQTDLATRESEADLAHMLLASQGHILEDVRGALSHLDDGTFGRCEFCGQPIGKTRLDVLPYARQCLACTGKTTSVKTA